MKLLKNKDELLKDKLFIEWYKSSQILDVLWVSFLELHFAVCVRHVQMFASAWLETPSVASSARLHTEIS